MKGIFYPKVAILAKKLLKSVKRDKKFIKNIQENLISCRIDYAFEIFKDLFGDEVNFFNNNYIFHQI